MNKIDDKIGCFISIPKNGSKSIIEILELGRNRDNDADEPVERYVIHENHQRLKVLEDRYDLSNLFTFGFCRNPYDRLISWYCFHKDIQPYKNLTFKEWVNERCPTHWTIQNQTNWIKEGLTPLLQYNFVEGRKDVDFIGRMENFDEDLGKIVDRLNQLAEEIGISRRFKTSSIRVNSSNKRKNVDEYYTPELKDKVYNMFKKDFEYFGYGKYD